MPIKAVKTDKFAVLDVFDALPPEEEEEEEYDEDLPPLEDREAGVEESKEEEEEVVVDDGWKTPERPIKKRKCPDAPKRLEDYAQPSFYHALPVRRRGYQFPKFPELPAAKKTSKTSKQCKRLRENKNIEKEKVKKVKKEPIVLSIKNDHKLSEAVLYGVHAKKLKIKHKTISLQDPEEPRKFIVESYLEKLKCNLIWAVEDLEDKLRRKIQQLAFRRLVGVTRLMAKAERSNLKFFHKTVFKLPVDCQKLINSFDGGDPDVKKNKEKTHGELYMFHATKKQLNSTPYTNEFAFLANWPHLEDRLRARATVDHYESRFDHITCALPHWVVFQYIQQSCTHENQCEEPLALSFVVGELLCRSRLLFLFRTSALLWLFR